MQIILASQSPYRKALMQRFGLPFEAHAPAVDEEELKKSGPDDLVELSRHLSLEKANSLRAQFPDAIIIGSDQLVDFEGRRLDKPGFKLAAKAQLVEMQGKTHQLVTSMAVVSPKLTQMFTDITVVHMRALTQATIDAYVELDNPIDCAGSYKIEKAGIALIEQLETNDPSAIEGLPLMCLAQALSNLGIQLEQLWR